MKEAPDGDAFWETDDRETLAGPRDARRVLNRLGGILGSWRERDGDRSPSSLHSPRLIFSVIAMLASSLSFRHP